MAKGKRVKRSTSKRNTAGLHRTGRSGRRRTPRTGGLIATLLPAAISAIPSAINAIGGLFKKK